MMISKGLALVSVLWNLAGNSEAPFLDRQPVTPTGRVAAPVAVPSAAPSVAASVAPPAVASPAPAPSVAASPVAPLPRLPLGPQKGPVLTAVHVTGWVVQSPQRMATLIEASKKGGLTAMVFEVKDVNGDLFFKMETPDGTNRFAEAIKNCHAAGLKVIARFCVFKDKAAEEKHPGTRYGTTAGTDRRHKPWTNPNAKASTEYNLGLIKELAAMGVDEVNLDYIRFPSAPEGVHIDLPLTEKCKSIAEFVRRARAAIPKPIRLSLDVFGYVAWDENSARVGQRLEDLAPHVDGIYPMLYPNHFAKGDLGYKHPVEHPYEVMRRGCEAARQKRGMERVDVIPWLQAFSLTSDSITYGPVELLAQIQGAKDAGVPSWLAWNPRVNYHELDRAMAMGKGKPDYHALVKRYVPKRYLAKADEEEDEDADPRKPASGVKVAARASPAPAPIASAKPSAAPLAVGAAPSAAASAAPAVVTATVVASASAVAGAPPAAKAPAATPSAVAVAAVPSPAPAASVAPLANPGFYGEKPAEAPANPFAAPPTSTDGRSESAVLGAAPGHKAKARKAAKPKKKKPAPGLEDVADDGMDAELYKYQPK